MIKLNSYILIAFLLAVSFLGTAQIDVRKNLQDFDSHKFHFGFILAYNKADFYIDKKIIDPRIDSIISLDVVGKSGFDLTIVSSLNLTETLRLRFLPGLSFQERDINYTFFDQPDTTETWNKTVSSTFLNFPLLIKMRTERIGNFAAYMIVGGKYSIDMQSNNKVDNKTASLKDQVVKIKKGDYGVEVGGGFDFFLDYFKFGVELKLGIGLKDALIQENLEFSAPIDHLRSKIWTLSFTFEG